MDKEQLRSIVQKYLDGKASEKEQKMLEAWIVLAEKQDRSLTAQEKEVIGQRIWNRLDTGVKEEASVEENKPRILRMGRRMLRYAALWIGILVVCCSGYFFRYNILDVIDPVALHTETTGAYEIRKITLPDSSVITLGMNSSITYPEKYRGIKRYARLNGKAFFSITHNEALPFFVESGILKVRVLGTSFEVENTGESNDVGVTVVTGRVQVSIKDEPVALLTRNQQITYHKKETLADVNKNVDAAHLTNWTNNQLVFNETPLATVLQTVANEYGITIQIAGTPIDTGATFSGSFTRNEKWKDILDIICISSGLKWSLTTANIVVVRKAS